MREIIRILYEHPVLLLFVVMWVVSGIASAAAKSKRAAQRKPTPEVDAYLERRRREREQAARPAPTAQSAPTQSAPSTQSAPAKPASAPTADDIARQLREMLGLETAPPPPPRPAPVPTDLPRDEVAREDLGYDERPHWTEADRGDDELVRGGQGRVGALHEEIEVKRTVPTAVARSVQSHLGHGPTRAAVRKVAPSRRVVFDPRAAAQAFVAMEVLGPPRALRPYDASSV